jgi:alpha-D-ribose 1-methylphosphonate 5-triphosphate synthase subunit PhnG
MEREARLQAIASADPDRLVALADDVLDTLEVEVTRGPTVGLLMVRVEEPLERLPFNFSEVTVSEAEVAVGPHRGYAMVVGKSLERALAGAVVDVAVEAGHPLTSRIEAFLTEAEALAEQSWAERWARIAPTRVRFEDVT